MFCVVMYSTCIMLTHTCFVLSCTCIMLTHTCFVLSCTCIMLTHTCFVLTCTCVVLTYTYICSSVDILRFSTQNWSYPREICFHYKNTKRRNMGRRNMSSAISNERECVCVCVSMCVGIFVCLCSYTVYVWTCVDVCVLNV